MTDLSKAGFIKSIQGREGGYLFAKDISEIYLSQIVDAVEGMDKYKGCVLGFDECSGVNPCVMHEIWLPMRKKLTKIFNDNTLADFSYAKINKF